MGSPAEKHGTAGTAPDCGSRKRRQFRAAMCDANRTQSEVNRVVDLTSQAPQIRLAVSVRGGGRGASACVVRRNHFNFYVLSWPTGRISLSASENLHNTGQQGGAGRGVGRPPPNGRLPDEADKPEVLALYALHAGCLGAPLLHNFRRVLLF